MNTLYRLKQGMIAILLLVCLSGCSQSDKQMKTSLDGYWRGSLLGVSDAEFTFVIKGDRLDHRGHGPGVDNWLCGSIVLNEEAEPKEMDLSIEDASNEQNLGMKVMLIYELQGDELKLAASNQLRPTNFVGGDGIQVYSLKRDLNQSGETGIIK